MHKVRCDKAQNDTMRPTLTCPSSGARKPWPFWYHGTENRRVRNDVGVVNRSRHTFFARFLRSLRSLRLVFGGATIRPDYKDRCTLEYQPFKKT